MTHDERMAFFRDNSDETFDRVCDYADALNERAERAEQALRSVAKDWRDGLAARKNGDTLAVELVQRIARMAEELETKNG
jgi:hypothetical protein